jgi:hypothetical protein
VEDPSRELTGVVAKGPAPLDPQRVLDQDDMTWKDYHPVPGVDWADARHKPSVRTATIALVEADFEDQPFVVTLPSKSDLFGNPQIDPVKREEVARFYSDFWCKPQEINHGRTVNEYWMEQSHGKYGVKFHAYGPCRMPRKMTEYGGTVNSSGRRGGAPEGQPGAAEARGGGSGASSGPRYSNWVIDAHPEDINELDFKRPNGEAVMRTIAKMITATLGIRCQLPPICRDSRPEDLLESWLHNTGLEDFLGLVVLDECDGQQPFRIDAVQRLLAPPPNPQVKFDARHPR